MATAPDLVLHVHSGDYDRLHQAAAFAASAAALGQSVLVAFYMYGLKALMDGDMSSIGLIDADGLAGELGAGMEKAGAPAAAELLARAREIGDVTVYGCSASTQFWGYTPAEVEGVVDKIGGITAILKESRGSSTVLYL